MTPLSPAGEDFRRALVVAAHPDDIEFGATSGLVARWVRQGKDVAFVVVSSGEAGIRGIAPERAGPAREREQVAACALVGVDDPVFLRLPDGGLAREPRLDDAVAECVRAHRPDVVLVINHHPDWGEGTEANHPDHVAVGEAVLAAARSVGTGGPRAVWVAGSPLARHGVDVTAEFDTAVAALEAHRVYLLGLRWPGFDARSWLEAIAAASGRGLGVPHAVAVEIIEVRADHVARSAAGERIDLCDSVSAQLDGDRKGSTR